MPHVEVQDRPFQFVQELARVRFFQSYQFCTPRYSALRILPIFYTYQNNTHRLNFFRFQALYLHKSKH